MKNVLEYLSESARKFPDKTAVIDDTTSITYSELFLRVTAIGSYLSKKNISFPASSTSSNNTLISISKGGYSLSTLSITI